MRNFPPPHERPPTLGQSLAECRVGDWVYCSNVFEWWGRQERQYFQPIAAEQRRSCYDIANFDPAEEIYTFERRPFMPGDAPWRWAVWVRVE